MCLAVPMTGTAIEGTTAHCAARGIMRRASLFLIQHEEIAVGDHALVQSGHVTQKVSRREAAETWALYDEFFAREDASRQG